MKAPIFVYEPNDLGVFESVHDAELKVETYDVRDESFFYYDADGQILAASVVKGDDGIERTVIHETAEKLFDEEGLREILLDFLIAVGQSKFDLDHLTLEELAARTIEYSTH
ncbi:MAG: hypothetical protein ABI481_01165 [Pyrinomonadaceae bacterium]